MNNLNKLKFVDLFCGAGGFSWGWVRAGYKPLAAFDVDSTCLRTYEANLGYTHCLPLHRDLNKLAPSEMLEIAGIGSGRLSVIIGGPPCQGWSKVGRGKIRSLQKAGNDLLADPRNSLYKRFVETVAHSRPKVCVMENVPGMLSVNGANIAEVVKANFDDIGYKCTYCLVNASWFGVPQDRNRLIFIATRKGIRKLNASGLKPFAKTFRLRFLGITKQTTVWDAIGDLPEVDNGSKEDPIVYKRGPGRVPEFVEIMRDKSNGLVTDHVCRIQNEQDVAAFKTMKEGMKYHQLEKRFKRYRDDIFKDKYKKLIWDAPSWTVTAHLGKDCYTHIHPGQARTISVREAARLQSFPDDFRFWGNLGDRFRQIGNAVPPLMAWGIAEYVKRHLSMGAGR